MAKRNPSQRLTILLRLAQMREEAAARQLGKASAQLSAAEQMSEQLASYEGEYHNSYLQRGASEPLSRQQLLNYQGFFQQLEQARSSQQQAIAQRAAEREQVRQQWLAQHARRRLLGQIRERRQLTESQQAEKRLQGELDDRVRRS
jgi:flagellar export protein FliJ